MQLPQQYLLVELWGAMREPEAKRKPQSLARRPYHTWGNSEIREGKCTRTVDNSGSAWCRIAGRTGSPPQPRIHSEDNAFTRP
jgi:hypothetical protein